MADAQIPYERPLMHAEDKPLLYRADGTPLRRPIGFNVQTSKTFPELASGGKKKGKGGKKC